MVLVAYAGPVRPAAALRESVLCLPTDIHSLFVNKPSSSSSSSPFTVIIFELKPPPFYAIRSFHARFAVVSKPQYRISFLISGIPGDKAWSRGPVTRVTCQGNQDSPLA